MTRWLGWLAALAGVTAAMVAVRGSLDKAHVALAYLMLVLLASSRAERRVGLALSIAAFLCFNFFFLPPYHALTVAQPLDWLVLVSFLATSLVAAQLLARAQSEAVAAGQRATEVDRLSAVGAEALNAPRAEDALAAIAGVIRSTLGVRRCEVYLRDERHDVIALVAESGDLEPPPPQDAEPPEDESVFTLPTGHRLVEWVASSGQTVIERLDGGVRVSVEAPPDREAAELDMRRARTLLVPLQVRGHTVGVLRIADEASLDLDVPRRRFIEALSYYAALGVERVRLVADAERAEALRRADTLKNALLASVSHDLRTPLTTIKALAHDIRMEGDERAAVIEEESDRLSRLVADLLDLSRLAGGAFSVSLEINAAEDLIGAAIQQTTGRMTNHTLDVHLDSSEPLLIGRFDFVHSLRVLVNLIENAVKYAPAGTAIELSVHRRGEVLEFVVADRGPGAPPGEEERIFEPFYRPQGSTPDAGGAGLGLSIARGMATAQGGSVTYTPREGGGSVFTLRLPAADLESS